MELYLHDCVKIVTLGKMFFVKVASMLVFNGFYKDLKDKENDVYDHILLFAGI
jgi:hypothetical protein